MIAALAYVLIVALGLWLVHWSMGRRGKTWKEVWKELNRDP